MHYIHTYIHVYVGEGSCREALFCERLEDWRESVVSLYPRDSEASYFGAIAGGTWVNVQVIEERPGPLTCKTGSVPGQVSPDRSPALVAGSG